MEQIFSGVMGLQEAKNHQLKLKTQGIDITLKVNDQTCTTGCKVTVEVWAEQADQEVVLVHFKEDYLKHVKGHEHNPEFLAQVFDPTASEVTCQACGSKFSPLVNECPDCGLMY